MLMRLTGALLFLGFILSFSSIGYAQTAQPTPAPRNYQAPVEGDYMIRNFRFRNGETLPELKIHYRPIGTPKMNSSGIVQNAVLIGHGTGGAGTQFLSPQFGNVFLVRDSYSTPRATSSSLLTASVMAVRANPATV